MLKAEQSSEGRTATASQAEHCHEVTYDRANDILTFDGFRFSGELMRQFTETPCGTMFRVTYRKDGVATVTMERHPLAALALDMLVTLKHIAGHFNWIGSAGLSPTGERVRAMITRANEAIR